jgi:hypothetical protein
VINQFHNPANSSPAPLTPPLSFPSLAVLDLVLCLLEMDPDHVVKEVTHLKGKIGEKFLENPPYILTTTSKESPFRHEVLWIYIPYIHI